MASKKRSKKEPCPYPGCRLKLEHGGDHDPTDRGGIRTGSKKWTPAKQAFVEGLKSGKIPFDAYKAAYPNDSNPQVHVVRLMKDSQVIEAMTEYHRLQKIAEEKAAEVEGVERGKRRAVTKAEVMAKLWELADLPSYMTNSSIVGQVRAALGLVEVLGMKIGAQNPDKFEGFTDSELEQYAKDGTVPERFASRFGLTPGSPTQIM